MSRRLSSVLILGLSCCCASAALGEPYGSLPRGLHGNGVAEFLPRIDRVQPVQAFEPRLQYTRELPKQDLEVDTEMERPAARFRRQVTARGSQRIVPQVRELGPQLAAIRESTGAVRRAVGRPVRADTNAAPVARTWSIRRAGDQRALFTRRESRL